MSFYETAWTMAVMVSRKSPDEIKVLVDDRVPYPVIDYMGRPVREYILHVPLPKKLVPYDLKENKVVMLRIFKACVAHEAGHAYLTDPLIYEAWRSEKDRKIASFVPNLLEDYRVEAFLSSKWTGLGGDLALANAVAYLRAYPVEEFDDKLKRVMAATASKAFVGCVKGNLSEEEEAMVDDISTALREVKWSSQPSLLISTAEKIYHKLVECGSSDKILNYPTAPHQDGKTSSEYFRGHVPGLEENTQETIKETISDILKKKKNLKGIFNKDDFSEAEYVFYRDELYTEKDKRILDFYQKNRFHFIGIGLPKNDYAKYLRAKRKITGPLSRILGVLAQVKSDYAEEPLQRAGLLDLTEAIQAVASKSNRTDVFQKWEKSGSSTAWAILIDNSQSLMGVKWELTQTSVCLAEVANGLMETMAWALYAFSDTFSIVKDFDEKYDKRVKYRLGGIITGGPTYLPDALKVAVPRLLTRPQNYKTIIVVTDGQPHGYEGIIEETKNAVKVVERSGINLIAVGLGSKKVQNFFKNWCYVNTLQDLAIDLTKLYFTIAMLTT